MEPVQALPVAPAWTPERLARSCSLCLLIWEMIAARPEGAFPIAPRASGVPPALAARAFAHAFAEVPRKDALAEAPRTFAPVIRGGTASEAVASEAAAGVP